MLVNLQLSNLEVIVINVGQIIMESYSVEQRVQIIKLYYQNECSVRATFRALRDFCDEAHFWMNGYVNKQNRCIWGDNNPHETHQLQMHPEKVTVWCGFWSGGVIGPYFFQNEAGTSITVTGERYKSMIINFLWPELEDMDLNDMWFQQDGATCHTAHATMDLLHDKFNGMVISRIGDVNWPLRSCDLTPLDYFLWGYVKSRVYANQPQTIDALKINITNAINDIEPDYAVESSKIGPLEYAPSSEAPAAIWPISYSIHNVIFYIVMFLENSLLIGVWIAGVNRADLLPHQHHLHSVTLVLILLALFFGGMFFMGLYYRFFHVRRLRYEAGGRMTGSNLTTLSNQDNTEEKQIDYNEGKKVNISIGMRKVKLSNGGIPGVFNCRFANPTVVNPNRKKKKPTSFVPPPPPPQSQTGTVMNSVAAIGDSKQWLNMGNGSRQLIPFWKKPISSNIIQNDGSNECKDESDMAIGGSLNITLIREKLKEKKQQQLRELRAIQEEIKEGKLFPPPSASTSSFSSSPSASNQQPPPNTKLHTSPSYSPLFTSPPSFSEQNGGSALSSWPPVKMHCLLPPPPSSPYYPNSHPSNPWRAAPQRERADTPEILLAPRCLPHHYPHWSPPGHLSHGLHATQNGVEESSKGKGDKEAEVSDMEGSQVLLPRSYTLPREFKYNPNSAVRERERRAGNNKISSSRFYLPSTNSSDGDVDSVDNENETDSEVQMQTNAHHSHNYDEILQRRHVYKNNEENDVIGPNIECGAPNNCYSNNSHGILRPSQLLRTRVKHEIKL